MIFDDRLIQNGEAGGREAAGLLWNAAMEHFQSDTGLPSDIKIVTRIYANLKGLGDACKKSGIMSSSSSIEDFARGFTGSQKLFDFVDVGVGKTFLFPDPEMFLGCSTESWSSIISGS